ncbi:hypothetical protein EON65_37550 [archaeon]|nr:MAG: hypothetical protein EON65_37550 [archaeon]
MANLPKSRELWNSLIRALLSWSVFSISCSNLSRTCVSGGHCFIILKMNGLSLDLSMRQQDGMDALGATYRDEGLSVGANHMVINKSTHYNTTSMKSL